MIRPACLPICLSLVLGCNDHTTGQAGEPDGPLRITRLTLLDLTSRDSPVFTDTSAPADCAAPEARATPACQTDIFKDLYGVKRSPPNPDSGRMIRVVFNKLPLLIDGRPLERVEKKPMAPPESMELSDPEAIALECMGMCTGLPPLVKSLQITGSPLSPMPTDPRFAYGPALQIEIVPDKDQPFSALEPETAYRIKVRPGIADRHNNRLMLEPQTERLLRFTTEPFQVLQAGIGDSDNDAWVYASTGSGEGTAESPYRVSGLALDGVVVLRLNAAIHDQALKETSVSARIGTTQVDAKAGIYTLEEVKGKEVCVAGDRRLLYIFPDTMEGTWSDKKGTVRIVLKGADVRDIAQPVAPGKAPGPGRHALPGDIVIEAELTGKMADDDYPGPTSDTVAAAADCMGGM
jgi:hypothetical protein